MRNFWQKAVCLALFLAVLCPMTALAASSSMAVLSGVRFGAARGRLVFDLDRIPAYNVSVENDGWRIILDLDGVTDRSGDKPDIHHPLISQAVVEKKVGGIRVVIDLAAKAEYRVGTLASPARLFLDIFEPMGQDAGNKQPFGDGMVEEEEPAPGLQHMTYVREDSRGKLTAHILEVDKEQYTISPALDRARVAGLETLSQIAAENQAVAAINSSYFASNGVLIGITKIHGQVVGTTYFRRTAVGMMPDGELVFGQVGYEGLVTLRGVTLPVSGVNCERGQNNLTIYNPQYNARTGTNEYGMEYIVRDGRVVEINQQNSEIPEDGIVISVHGTAQEAFAGVEVGDEAIVWENLGEPWGKALWIQGVGPRLVQGGQVHVTAGEEEFPADIARGRAPRTALGVTKEGNYLLAVADGRQSHSIGCTLTEMAELMQQFGAVDAMNFDGGGSSEMVIEGTVVNSPSDGRERRIGCALIVTKKS